MALFSSSGLKRLIASALCAVIEVLRSIPGTGEIVAVLEALAGVFGVTGLAHAAVAKTVSQKKLAGVASLIAILIIIAQYVPALQPYVPLLEKIAAILGSAGVGVAIAVKTT